MSTLLNLFRTLDFNPLLDIGPSPPPQLQSLISSSPALKVYTQLSPHFPTLKSIWNLNYATNSPLAIIRPTSTSEVTTVVKFCSANKLSFAVRSGGHDLFGRSIVHDAVILDIRELNHVALSEDKKTVTIGGGIQSGDLVDFLDERGLVTSCTLAGVVGWAGWAFGGGFGMFNNVYGLGVDQIVGVKVVTADGEVVDANAGDELLWGIKGAGGAFGVVTELRVKVYRLGKMLGGMLMFPFEQAAGVVEGLNDMFEKERVPKELVTGMHFAKKGGMAMLAVAVSWASEDLDEGRKWAEKIKGFGNVMMDMVAETTIKKWSDSMASMLPPPSHNHSRSFFLSKMTPAAVKILSSATELIPDGMNFASACFFVGGEAIKPHPDSAFRFREPYVFVHALAPVSDPSMNEQSKEWSERVHEELQKEGLVMSNYIAILDEGISVEDCFGKENFERLKVLKKKVDPENFFRFTSSKLV